MKMKSYDNARLEMIKQVAKDHDNAICKMFYGKDYSEDLLPNIKKLAKYLIYQTKTQQYFNGGTSRTTIITFDKYEYGRYDIGEITEITKIENGMDDKMGFSANFTMTQSYNALRSLPSEFMERSK